MIKPTSLLLAVLLSTGSLAFANSFFKPGPSVPGNLPRDQVYPRGSAFLFTFYSVGGGPHLKEGEGELMFSEAELDKLFREYHATGFRVFGPQYELKERSLQDAAKYGLKTVYTVGLPVKFTKEQVVIEENKLTEEITRQIKELANDPNIAVWDLRPEEIRPWRKNEILYLNTAAAAIKAADPLKRPIYHYIPGHASAQRMIPIAKQVDLLGKGMYTNYSGMKQSRVWCRWTIEQEIAAIKEANSQAVPVAVPEMFQQPPDEELPLIPSWVRHDVYLSLVSGAKGILVFSLRQRDNFTAWEPYYRAYRQIGRELLGPDRLADVFLFGEPRNDLAIKVVSGPAEVEMNFPVGGVKEPVRYPSVAFLNTAFENARYLFLVNSANEAVEVAIDGIPSKAKATDLLAEKREPATSLAKVSLKPLEVRAYRITQP